MSLNYDVTTYRQVLETKERNDIHIKNTYSILPNLSIEDSIIALKLIDNLRIYQLEYTKYILTYQELNETKQKTTYTVIEGDTLPRIANKTLGDTNKWQKIYQFNNLSDIVLLVGQILEIPNV